MYIKINCRALKANGEKIPVESIQDAEKTAAEIAGGLFMKYERAAGLAVMESEKTPKKIIYTFKPALILYKPVTIEFLIIG